MTATIIQFPKRRRESRLNAFGGCPNCGGFDGYKNIARQHWFFCERHKTKWCAGENLLTSWLGEDAATWADNGDQLSNFREVDPSRYRGPIR